MPFHPHTAPPMSTYSSDDGIRAQHGHTQKGQLEMELFQGALKL